MQRIALIALLGAELLMAGVMMSTAKSLETPVEHLTPGPLPRQPVEGDSFVERSPTPPPVRDAPASSMRGAAPQQLVRNVRQPSGYFPQQRHRAIP